MKAIFCLLFFTMLGACSAERQWPETLNWIRQSFPEAPQMTIAEFKNITSHNKIVIDVRSKKEFNISRIPSALHAEDRQSIEKLIKQNPNKVIILYCSVGYRSSKLTQALKNHKKIFNLEGSIFMWANEGGDLEGPLGPTQLVHPFNKDWGRLLRKELHSPI